MGELVPVSVSRSLDEWAERITEAWQSTVDGILRTGRELIACKADVDHGWERLFPCREHPVGMVPFTVRTAQMLMAIARHQVLSKTNHGSFLPPSWRTLYELTKVDTGILEREMAAGAIRPELQRSEVRRLIAESKEAKRAREAATQAAKEAEADGFSLQQEAATLLGAVRSYSVEQWMALSADERQSITAAGCDASAKLVEQRTDSIEWARWSLNTVTGCLHDCPYCYARDIAERFFPEGFTPTFHPSRLSAPSQQLPPPQARQDPSYRHIFANSMSDLFGQWVPDDWIEATIDMARRNPAWVFLTLTKFPIRAASFDYPENWWMGTSVDAQCRVSPAEEAFSQVRCGTKWLSVEPLLEPLTFSRLDLFDWMVIGGSSKSTKTPKWVPPFAWLAALDEQARAAGVKRYYKTNTDLPDVLRVREFPWIDTPAPKVPRPFRYLKGM